MGLLGHGWGLLMLESVFIGCCSSGLLGDVFNEDKWASSVVEAVQAHSHPPGWSGTHEDVHVQSTGLHFT